MTATARRKLKYLDPAEAATAVRQRLETLERDLVNVSLDVAAAGPGVNPTQETRVAELEARIEELEKWATELDAQAG